MKASNIKTLINCFFPFTINFCLLNIMNIILILFNIMIKKKYI